MKKLETFVFRWLWNILGSMKGCSTTIALIEMFDSWSKTSDNASIQIIILLLDYRKAFDHIDHNILMAKLMSYGVLLVLLRWVHAFLADIKQRIKGWSSYVKVGNSKWRCVTGNQTWISSLHHLDK